MIPPSSIHLIPFAAGALIAVILWLIPRWTRHDRYFGLTVAPDFRNSVVGLAILRRYRRALFGVSGVALTLLVMTVVKRVWPIALQILLLQLVASLVVIYRARRLVLPHAIVRMAVEPGPPTQRDRRFPGDGLVAAGPFAVLAACAIYLGIHWNQIPARVVTQWDSTGQPSRWGARALGTVFFPLLSTTAILAALTLLAFGTTRLQQATRAARVLESRLRATAFILLLSVEYCLALQAAWIALQPLLPASHRGPPGIDALLMPVLIAVPIVAVLMRLRQGSRSIPSAQSAAESAAESVPDRTEDRFWKLGVIYFNRDDPAVMVEKRSGIGYTVNFAHPVAWVSVLLLVLSPIVIAHLTQG